MRIKRVKENPFYSGCGAQINWVLIERVVRRTFDIYWVDLGIKTMVTLIVLSNFFLDLHWQSINVEAEEIPILLDQKRSILSIYRETFS